MRTEAALKLHVPPFVSCALDFLHRDSPYAQVRPEEILELFQNPQADAERTGAGYVFSGCCSDWSHLDYLLKRRNIEGWVLVLVF